MLLHSACVLRVPELLASSTKTARELAAEAGLEASRLRRLLRGLAVIGVVSEGEDGRFELTGIGRLFIADAPGSLRAVVTGRLPDLYRVWGHLTESVRTGRTGFEIEFGKTVWERVAESPDAGAHFNAAMVRMTEAVVPLVDDAFDFGRASTVVDVGGGSGALVGGLLARHPHLQGTVCDLQAGLVQASAYLAAAGVGDRCRLVTADFFESVEPGSDVYLLKSVLHDWYEEDATRILRTCRVAARDGSALLVIERDLPTVARTTTAARDAVLGDLQMLVGPGGEERTEDQYRLLLSAAGFELCAKTARGGWAVYEARPTP